MIMTPQLVLNYRGCAMEDKGEVGVGNEVPTTISFNESSN